ncbi:peptidoglycan-binding protein [Janibacter sp. GS2]|uniref:peptidoglycan-binding protein n=1 Tax=Janibacter sp. GS2 TaxID=3442646 RepID=UPI003EBD3AFF
MSTTHNTDLDRRSLLRIAGTGALGATALAVAGPGLSSAHAAARIIPRTQWGFNGWQAGGPPALPTGDITHFVVHYHGATGANVNGPGVPRRIHADHKAADANNSGILYNFVITQDGAIYRARGYEFKSGATKGANDFSIGVQIHIHGSTKPSSAALSSLEWLYRHSHQALDSTQALQITGHGDHKATACPGGPLGQWVDGRGQELHREMAEELGDGGGSQPPPFPGADAFRLGQSHPAVETLDQGLIAKGYTQHHDGDGYQAGTTFSTYTRRNVRDFQQAQGWSGADADGYPGPETWRRLVS